MYLTGPLVPTYIFHTRRIGHRYGPKAASPPPVAEQEAEDAQHLGPDVLLARMDQMQGTLDELARLSKMSGGLERLRGR